MGNNKTNNIKKKKNTYQSLNSLVVRKLVIKKKKKLALYFLTVYFHFASRCVIYVDRVVQKLILNNGRYKGDIIIYNLSNLCMLNKIFCTGSINECPTRIPQSYNITYLLCNLPIHYCKYWQLAGTRTVTEIPVLDRNP